MIALKIISIIVGFVVGIWAGFKIAGLAIAWLKEGFRKLSPPRND